MDALDRRVVVEIVVGRIKILDEVGWVKTGRNMVQIHAYFVVHSLSRLYLGSKT